MSRQKEKAVLPKLRFPEFRDAGPWVIKKIGDYFDVCSSKRVLQKDWQEEGVPFYRTRELVALSKNEPFNSKVYISEELFSELANKYGLPEEGDFLVSGVGTLGIAYQVKAGDRFYFKDGNVLWLHRKSGINSTFFLYSFGTTFVQKQIKGGASVSTVGTYTIEKARKTSFACPPTKEEQQKIADCLSSLDELIRAEAARLEALKNHKKGLMQQLFPREGETTPRLRFPEFRNAGPWEVKRLGEVSEILDNMRKPVTSTKRKPGPYPYYGASGVIDYIDEYIFDERLLLIGEDGAKWGPFEKTSFIAEGKYWVNNHAHVLRPIVINDVLLENYLNATDVSVYVTGAAPPKLTLDNLKSIHIPVPLVQEEQQKIADCLSSLDDLIRAQGEKIEALQQHKKGLMQQLFPQEVNP